VASARRPLITIGALTFMTFVPTSLLSAFSAVAAADLQLASAGRKKAFITPPTPHTSFWSRWVAVECPCDLAPFAVAKTHISDCSITKWPTTACVLGNGQKRNAASAVTLPWWWRSQVTRFIGPSGCGPSRRSSAALNRECHEW